MDQKWLDFNKVITRFETLLAKLKTEQGIIIVPALLKNTNTKFRPKDSRIQDEFLCLWLQSSPEPAACFLQDSWFSTDREDTKWELTLSFPVRTELREISIDIFKKALEVKYFALFYDYEGKRIPVEKYINADRFKARQIITSATTELVSLVYRTEIFKFMKDWG